jgi:DtxR family Mn-dependent transcriptional regulator
MAEGNKHPNARRRHVQPGPTEKMREYLEVIYYLSARREPVIAARLAEWMRVTAPTVTDIIKRMEKQGYITRDGRGDIGLTTEGFTLAEAMVKRHRILERFLVDVMGIPWHLIHEEAVRLEHALSPTMEQRIEALVGRSTTCPHGNPIPGSGNGYAGDTRLDRAAVGDMFTLQRIVEEAEEDSDLMRYLQSNGLTPSARLEVVDSSPSYGITLRRDDQTITLSPQIAAQLWGEVQPR